MTLPFPINYLTSIYFREGALSDLPAILEANKINHPLIVTDKGLIRAPYGDAIARLLEKP